LAVPDSRAAAAGWIDLLGAEPEGQDHIKCLGAKRHSYRLGTGIVELLEPDGSGAIADAVTKRGGHLFSAGASTNEFDRLVAHLQNQKLDPLVEAGQAFLDPAATGDFGLRVVVSPEEELSPVGVIDFFYEVTLLVRDANARVKQFASIFGLDGDVFVPINSDHYGYDGSLTLFHPDHLGRFEMITPNVPENTMGRFFSRFGETYYMAYAESASVGLIEDRAREANYDFTATPANKPAERIADTVFIHPPVLGGMMLGISRPTVAWQWSGHPERVEAADLTA
jgi:hypothetical protein